MDEIFHQLGDLFLGSIPTMILFLLLVFCYTVLVDHPLRRTLAERRERTAGAQEKARAAIALAEEKTRHYQEQLRAARVEILANREKQVAGWNTAREKQLSKRGKRPRLGCGKPDSRWKPMRSVRAPHSTRRSTPWPGRS